MLRTVMLIRIVQPPFVRPAKYLPVPCGAYQYHSTSNRKLLPGEI
jgi:hypothetical protein